MKVYVPALAQNAHHPLELAILVQRSLREPVVIPDTHEGEVLLGLGHNPLQPQGTQLVHGLLAGHLQEPAVMFAGDLCCEADHVRPVIALLRNGLIAAQRLGITRIERLVEGAHAASGVVHIVFALHPIARGLQYRGQRVAQHRVAGRADMQRTGGVGANVLNLHLAPLAQRDVSICLACRQDLCYLRRQPCPAQTKVDEPRVGHLHPRHKRELGQVLDHGLGDLDRGHAGVTGQLHADRRGKVALGLLVGPLHRDLVGESEGRQIASSLRPSKCSTDGLTQLDVDQTHLTSSPSSSCR